VNIYTEKEVGTRKNEHS